MSFVIFERKDKILLQIQTVPHIISDEQNWNLKTCTSQIFLLMDFPVV